MLSVADVFKASLIKQRLNLHPKIQPDEHDSRRVVFLFPDTEQVREVVREYLADKNGIKTFIEVYRLLRTEMYLARQKERENGNYKTDYE